MKQIYTKTGDKGMTGLRGGTRVPKDDMRIEVNGQIDHLNACLGMVRCMMDEEETDRLLLYRVQQELMTVMSHIATPDDEVNPRPLHTEEITKLMEQAIDAISTPTGFVIHGDGGMLSARLHLARTEARTVERRLWTFHRQHPVDESIPVMFNRLSDYLFILALKNEKR